MQSTANYLCNMWDMENLFLESLEATIVKDFAQVERVHDISVDDFNEQYVKVSRPVILCGQMEGWAASTQWDSEFFRRECGDIQVKQHLYDPRKYSVSSISDVMQRIDAADDVVYIQEWWAERDFPQIREYFSVPAYFQNDWHSKLFEKLPAHLWIGSAGAVTPLHQDGHGINVWSSQVKGVKRWLLADRDAKIEIAPDGTPALQEFLNNPASQLCYGELQAGEILFLPSRWWHRVSSLSPSISINTQFVTDQDCVPYIQRIMQILLSLSLDDREEVLARNPTLFNAYIERAGIWRDYLDQSSAPKVAY